MSKTLLQKLWPFGGHNRLTLNTPTHFCQLNDWYFIVDCWNNRILTSKDLSTPITEWIQITGFNHPHKILFYQGFYYVVDTDNHRIIKLNFNFTIRTILVFPLNFNRVHDLLFFKNTILLTDSENLNTRLFAFDLRNDFALICQKTIRNAYCRGFRIIDNLLYVCDAGGGRILIFDPSTLQCLIEYQPNATKLFMGSLNQQEQRIHPNRMIPNEIIAHKGRFFLSNYFYSKTYNRLISFKSLKDWVNGDYVDHSQTIKGVPYYMESINDNIYLGEIDDYSRCIILECTDDKLKIVKIIE